jgi:DNA processing protein
VIGTPLNQFYPAKNRELQRLIAEKHLLISQFPLDSKTSRGNFPQRNLTMALIADACVIVEAKDESGSLYLGAEALRLGRPLAILESAVNDASLSWPKEYLEQGAFVLSSNGVNEFVSQLARCCTSQPRAIL